MEICTVNSLLLLAKLMQLFQYRRHQFSAVFSRWGPSYLLKILMVKFGHTCGFFSNRNVGSHSWPHLQCPISGDINIMHWANFVNVCHMLDIFMETLAQRSLYRIVPIRSTGSEGTTSRKFPIILFEIGRPCSVEFPCICLPARNYTLL